MPATIVIEILTKNDCCLCDDLKEIVNRVLPDYPVKLVMINIESDRGLYKYMYGPLKHVIIWYYWPLVTVKKKIFSPFMTMLKIYPDLIQIF